MNSSPELKTLERRIWLAYNNDGVLTIGLALILMFVFVNGEYLDTNDTARYISTVMLLIVPGAFILLAKRYITIPRMGYVKFGAIQRRRQFIVFAIFLLGFLHTTALLMFVSGRTEPLWGIEPATLMSVAIVGKVLLVTLLIAYVMRSRQLAIFGLCVTAAICGVEFADTYMLFPPVILFLLGMGIAELVIFMRKYTPAREEQEGVNGQ